jgi:hypothetical protein
MPAIGAQGKSKDKTDLLPAPAGATEKSHPSYFSAYKGVIVHRRPMFIATMADRDTWLRWLANKVEEVKRNRKKDSDAIARLKEKNKGLEKGWTSEADKKKIKKNKDTIKSLEAKLKQHDVRKEFYSNTTPYVRDLYERISKAATPEEKQAAAQAAQYAQKSKDSGVTAETAAPPVSAQEAVAAEAVPEEPAAPATEVQTVSTETETTEPTFFERYKTIIFVGSGLLVAGGAYLYLRSDSTDTSE